jgi:hypothetical protein
LCLKTRNPGFGTEWRDETKPGKVNHHKLKRNLTLDVIPGPAQPAIRITSGIGKHEKYQSGTFDLRVSVLMLGYEDERNFIEPGLCEAVFISEQLFALANTC